MSDVTPRVSVVIPCFNATATLAATLRSVLAQTYYNFEVIAVDDRSTDDTLDLLRAQEVEFGGRLHILALERNRGSAGARNAGIEIARGAYLALLDADDEWHPDKTARQVDYLDVHDETVFVGCRAQEFLDGVHSTLINGDHEPTIGPQAWRLMLHHPYFVPSMVMGRMEVVRAIGGFDPRRYVVDDQDFLIRLAMRGAVGLVDELLVTIGFSAMSLSNRNRLREPELVLPMLQDLFALAGDRLTSAERNSIMGARLAKLGRNLYPSMPTRGSGLLFRAIARGDAPLANLAFLVTACPWLRPVKQLIRGAR